MSASKQLMIDLGLEPIELEKLLLESSATECYFGSWSQENKKKLTCHQLWERLDLVANKLEGLKELKFGCAISSLEQDSFPIRGIGEFLKLHAGTLQKLKFQQWNYTISGTTEDYECFFTHLGACSQLQEFSIDWDCQFQIVGKDATLPRSGRISDSVVLALSQIACLDKVIFWGNWGPSAQAMAQLCRAGRGRLSLRLEEDFSLSSDMIDAICGPSSRLAKLVFYGVECTDEDMKQMWMHIRDHPTIRRFFMNGPLEMAESLIVGLQENVSLEELELRVVCEGDEMSQKSSRLSTIQNVRLQKIRLSFIDVDPKCALEAAESIMRGLNQNRWEEVCLDIELYEDDGIPTAVRGEIQDTLKSLGSELERTLSGAKNTTLKDFKMEFSGFVALPSDVSKFWLDVNQVGRGQLLNQPENHGLWINTLLDVKDNHSVSFWLLSSNPALFPANGYPHTKGAQEMTKEYYGIDKNITESPKKKLKKEA